MFKQLVVVLCIGEVILCTSLVVSITFSQMKTNTLIWGSCDVFQVSFVLPAVAGQCNLKETNATW